MPRTARLIGLAVVAMSAGAPSAQTTSGSLDPTFSTDGKFGTACNDVPPWYPFPIYCDTFVRAIALQDDGKFVVVGSDGDKGEGGTFFVRRYTADGDEDSTFTLQYTDVSPERDAINAVAIQADGKIVVAGFADRDLALARYLPDASLDESFGAAGVVVTRMGLDDSAARALVVQPDGKLVTAGSVDLPVRGRQAFSLARHLPDGQLDPTFGTDGSSQLRSANALVLQPDGKLVIGGDAVPTPEGNAAFAVARFNADGSLDGSFGTGGGVFTEFPDVLTALNALALQRDGKLLAAGRAGGSFALVRFFPDGTRDAAFGVDGRVLTDFLGTTAEVRGLVIQPDDKIVAAGTSTDPGGFSGGGGPLPAMARYLP